MAWNERIDHALTAGLLRRHFQGVYHAQGGQRRLQALVRMVDETIPPQLAAPGQFIGPRRKERQDPGDRPLGGAREHSPAAHPQLPALALNISGRSLHDPSAGLYHSQLTEQGVAPQRLLVELTETAAISDLGDAQRFIDALQRAGWHSRGLKSAPASRCFAILSICRRGRSRSTACLCATCRTSVTIRCSCAPSSKSPTAWASGRGRVCSKTSRPCSSLQAMGVDMVQGYHLDKPAPTTRAARRGLTPSVDQTALPCGAQLAGRSTGPRLISRRHAHGMAITPIEIIKF